MAEKLALTDTSTESADAGSDGMAVVVSDAVAVLVVSASGAASPGSVAV
ncbi:hypothetical protein ACWFPY_08995 [Nocardia fluminea]